MPEPAERPPALPPAGHYRLDPQHTFAQFGVRHMLVGQVDGRFDSLAGVFVVLDDPDRLFEGIDVRIDAASIDTNVAARDEDLRSGRFFDVASFPELAFRGTESRRLAENGWRRSSAARLSIPTATRGSASARERRSRGPISTSRPSSRRNQDRKADSTSRCRWMSKPSARKRDNERGQE